MFQGLNHACMAAKRKLVISWISGEALEPAMEVHALFAAAFWIAIPAAPCNTHRLAACLLMCRPCL